MAIPAPISDRRVAPRTKVHLGCRFVYSGSEYNAFIKDISPTGALLWSAFMPPPAADVSIKIEKSFLGVSLVLEGRIVRRECKETEQGTIGAFAVHFNNNSPGIMLLFKKLTGPAQMP